MDGSHPAVEIPLLKCLPSALSIISTSPCRLSDICFKLVQQVHVLQVCFSPKECDYAFKPFKELDMLFVCARRESTLLSMRKKMRERRGFYMQISPTALSASPHTVHSNTDIGCNKEDSQVNRTKLPEWV